MLFHTPFGSIGKCLWVPCQINDNSFRCSWHFCTFAISPQLLCASLIVFSRCSSAGVQGVFVLLFLGAVIGDMVSPMGSIGSTKPPGSPIPVEGSDSPAIDCMIGALRFRVGDVVPDWGASNNSSG